MIFPSMKQILLHHPYLVPFLLVLPIYVLVAAVAEGAGRLLDNGTCRDCPNGKLVCLSACPEVSRRFDQMDENLKSRGL